MVKPLRDYSLTNYEIENLFRSRLNQDQIYYMSLITKTIAKYMVVDRDILEERVGEKIGLGYLSSAVNWGLITELKYRDNNSEKNIFHFHLATAGINFAIVERFIINKLPLSADQHIKSRVVTFNKWALQNHYDLINHSDSVSNKFNYFISFKNGSKKLIVSYYEQMINEAVITKEILKKLNDGKEMECEPYTITDVYKKYYFEAIGLQLIQIGNKSFGSERSGVGDSSL
ncbi:MAG TPA: hypothetical protein VIK86_04310 [Candidatus Paceibacterota bacterium]